MRITRLFPDLDPTAFSFIPVLDVFHEGVTVTDADGRILYMNQAQARIDDIDAEDAIGMTVLELYSVDEGVSPTIQCLRTRTPITNLAVYYRTKLGKMVNSIHNVYPLIAGGALHGAIIFICDYGALTAQSGKPFPRHPSRELHPTARVTSRSHRSLKNGTRFTFKDIMGSSVTFTQAVQAAQMASESPSPIMLYGETGTGKELIAQAIHNHSSRRASPYVAVNCAAIPENLLEGILFGTTKGAFTGAVDKAGLFEEASGGTLFLDEVNSMAIGLQAKLLRTLQERKVRRVGALKEREVDLKLISSVNQNPHVAIEQGALRSDLLYRLGVVFIMIPPLRERPEDIESLAHYFLYECNKFINTKIQRISRQVLTLFKAYRWPGNVRELEHVIEGAANMAKESQTLFPHHLTVHLAGEALRQDAEEPGRPPESPAPAGSPPAPSGLEPGEERPKQQDLQESHKAFERRAIVQALIQTDGNASHAARKLGISPQLMHYKLKRYGICAKDYKAGVS